MIPFPSLLPTAISVSARTISSDIVGVIPMPNPSGVLTYLDYTYDGFSYEQHIQNLKDIKKQKERLEKLKDL